MDVIEVNNVSKTFRLYHDKTMTLKESLLHFNRTKYEELEVLKDVSLNIEKGQAIGLIGKNGSGKSTLLKLLTGIMYPNSGTIKIHGKVSSLLELGAGFHPDFSGRENIYNNASVFGLNKKEIERRFNTIVDFSELHDFIDNPIRTYSSGMYMRLAFSVAINVDAEILLIDEILAVGDASFQKKCFGKIRALKKDGVTIVMVTHDMNSIINICDRAVWLNDGKIKQEGPCIEITNNYLEFMNEDSKQNEIAENTESGHTKSIEEPAETKTRWGNRDVYMSDIKMFDSEGNESNGFECGETGVKISFKYNRKNSEINNPVIGVGIFRIDGVAAYSTNTRIDRIYDINIKDSGEICFYIDRMCLLPGEYFLDITMESKDNFPYDYYRNAYTFKVYSNINDTGVVRLEHDWTVDALQLTKYEESGINK